MLHLGNSPTELWVNLLQEAEARARTKLTTNQESYLVFMLMRQDFLILLTSQNSKISPTDKPI
jgi:hypothetical protein